MEGLFIVEGLFAVKGQFTGLPMQKLQLSCVVQSTAALLEVCYAVALICIPTHIHHSRMKGNSRIERVEEIHLQL